MLRGHRILLVEDEPLISLDVQSELTDAGADVVLATTFDEALLKSDDAQLTGAILDMGLHGISVRPVAERLAQRGIPFVFHSGRDAATTARGFSAAPVVLKPAEAGQLVDMLRRAIEAKLAS